MDYFEKQMTIVFYGAMAMGLGIFIFGGIKLCPTIGCDPLGMIVTSLVFCGGMFVPFLMYRYKHPITKGENSQ